MQRFRTQWLAVFGALVILSLSLGSAFGARPTANADETTNRGQQVRAFVHSLLFGEQEEGDEDETEECDPATSEDCDEEPGDEEPGDEDSDEPKNHGQCVAEVAHSDEVGENGTHGWAVSLAARITCWLAFADDEDGEEQSDEDSAEDSDEGAEDESEATSEMQRGKSDAAHQRKADRAKGKPSWAGAKAHGGQGHGHGRGASR